MKNWKTSASAIVSIALIVLKLLGVEVPGVADADSLGNLGTIIGAAGLLFAKDKDVTGAGPSAHRVE